MYSPSQTGVLVNQTHISCMMFTMYELGLMEPRCDHSGKESHSAGVEPGELFNTSAMYIAVMITQILFS